MSTQDNVSLDSIFYQELKIKPATQKKLEEHAKSIRSKVNTIYQNTYAIGKELQKAHDELANHRNGVFYKWCEGIGLKRETVKNIINYRNFIDQNLANKEIIETMPKSFIYEVSRNSTPKELQEMVINGEIKNLKELKTEKAKYKARKKQEVSKNQNDTVVSDIQETTRSNDDVSINQDDLQSRYDKLLQKYDLLKKDRDKWEQETRKFKNKLKEITGARNVDGAFSYIRQLEEHIETINITPDDVEDVISDDDDRWESF